MTSNPQKHRNLGEPNDWDKVASRQNRMLRLLQHSTIDPVSYAGLAYCGRDQCGRVGCSEACWFGTARRQAAEMPPSGLSSNNMKARFTSYGSGSRIGAVCPASCTV